MLNQKLRTVEIKTAEIGKHHYLSKVRNTTNGKIIVAIRYHSYALIIDPAQNILRAYAGPQAPAEYLKYIGLAATQEIKAEEFNMSETDMEGLEVIAEMAYKEALEIR